jgi:phosphoenolpyruvate phosphomutase
VKYTQPQSEYNGEWIGIMKLSAKGMQHVKDFITQFENDPEFKKMEIRDMLNYFVNNGINVTIEYISGHWVDVDTIMDLNLASTF